MEFYFMREDYWNKKLENVDKVIDRCSADRESWAYNFWVSVRTQLLKKRQASLSPSRYRISTQDV